MWISGGGRLIHALEGLKLFPGEHWVEIQSQGKAQISILGNSFNNWGKRPLIWGLSLFSVGKVPVYFMSAEGKLRDLLQQRPIWVLFLKKKKVYVHISDYCSQRICWVLSGQASQQTNHPGCDTQGTSSTMDEDCVIAAIFVDLSKAFALAGHKLPLRNFRNLGPCRDCIRWFALTWEIVQERKPCEHRIKGITNGTPEGVFYFLCLMTILQSNVFSPLHTCMLLI